MGVCKDSQEDLVECELGKARGGQAGEIAVGVAGLVQEGLEMEKQVKGIVGEREG